MAIKRSFAFALLGVLTIAVAAPISAQTTPPTRTRQSRPRTPRAERRMERMQNNMNSGMSGGGMAPVSAANNTAVVQGNIDRANQTLSNMVALLDQIEARKKPGASASTTPAAQ